MMSMMRIQTCYYCWLWLLPTSSCGSYWRWWHRMPHCILTLGYRGHTRWCTCFQKQPWRFDHQFLCPAWKYSSQQWWTGGWVLPLSLRCPSRRWQLGSTWHEMMVLCQIVGGDIVVIVDCGCCLLLLARSYWWCLILSWLLDSLAHKLMLSKATLKLPSARTQDCPLLQLTDWSQE